jgi:hypothetical protein
MVRATIQCPTAGTETGVEYPIPRTNGTADQFRGAGGRMVLPAEVERGVHRAQYFLERLQFGDRAGQLLRALAQFSEQPDVLDRNDGLIGEGSHEIDLRLGERLDVPARHGNGAHRRAGAQHRYRQQRCRTG